MFPPVSVFTGKKETADSVQIYISVMKDNSKYFRHAHMDELRSSLRAEK
jgi:hypothetical protein